MQVKSEKQTRFADELRFIPRWVWVMAVSLALVGMVSFDVAMAHDPKAPPFFIALGFPLGVFLGCYLLLVGYVNCDAGRRGMNRWVWTLLAIFVPNALGIVLYFLLRQPLPSVCPHCGARVQSGYGYCPKCGKNLVLHCPHCQQAVHADDVYCPHCGKPLTAADASAPVPQPKLS